jgi:hemoglobin/transferrin/lactoferrin receptor protein
MALSAAPALAQGAKAAPAKAEVDCKVAPDDPSCVPPKSDAKGGSTYLTPLVVSGDSSGNGIGDPYAKPAAVSTVGSEEINQFGGQNIDNVLRTQPGTFTRDNAQNPGVAVNVRGLEGSGRVNMTIDGARQNFRFTGHEAQGFTYVDPAMLSGVDVTRGSDAGANGAGALAGSVNFRTLSADDVIKGDNPMGGYTSITAGTNGEGPSEAAAAGFRINDTFAIIGAVSKRNPADYTNGAGQVVVNTGQDILSGLVKTEVTPTLDQKLTISGLFYNDKFFANSYPQAVDNRTYSLLYDYTPEDNELVDLHVGLHANDTRMEYFRNSTTTGGSAQGRIIDDLGLGFDATNTSRGNLGDVEIKSTYGVTYSTDDVAVRNTTLNGNPGVNPPGKSSIGSIFTSTTLSYSIVDLIAGLRYDHFTASGQGTTTTGTTYNLDRSEGRFDPSFTIALNPTDWFQPYVSYAETFRAPTTNELLTGGSHPGSPATGFLPNPTLRPELSRGWEIGANFRRDGVFTQDDSIRLKADYFNNSIEDYITGQPVGMTGAIFANNPGISHVQGIELEAAYDAGFMFGSVGYTHTATDLPSQLNGFGAQSYLPDDIFTTTLAGRFLDDQSLTIGTRLYAVSRAYQGTINVPAGTSPYTPGYQLVDLFANYKLQNGVELGANIANVFDVAYTPALSTPGTTAGIPTGRGRTFELTAKASF